MRARIAWQHRISLVLLLMCTLSVAHGPALAAATERISVSSSGQQGNDECLEVAISADARFVAFSSKASNLVAEDTNGEWDVFVHDRLEGTTERVSVAGNGEQGNGDSGRPTISADGRFVVFVSAATNLVEDDTNLMQDVFVRDRQEGSAERASVSISGEDADGDSVLPAISADGRFVASVSTASNLVAADANEKKDIFLRDRVEGRTYRVSIGNGGEESDDHSFYCSISADGRWVAFHSSASNLAGKGKVRVCGRHRLRNRSEEYDRLVPQVPARQEGLAGSASMHTFIEQLYNRAQRHSALGYLTPVEFKEQ